MTGQPLPGQPMMPMGVNAANKSTPANLMPPMPRGGSAPPPLPQAAPPATPAPMPQASIPALPAPTAPQQPPFKVRPQADGSLAVIWPAPDGSDIVSQVYPAPKIPRAMQPGRPQQ